MIKITENAVEQTCLEWFQGLGYEYAFGPDISPDGLACERDD